MPVPPGAEHVKASASCSSAHQRQQCTPWVPRVRTSSASCSRQPSLQSAAGTPSKPIKHLQDAMGAHVSYHLQKAAAAWGQQQACAKACSESRHWIQGKGLLCLTMGRIVRQMLFQDTIVKPQGLLSSHRVSLLNLWHSHMPQ